MKKTVSAALALLLAGASFTAAAGENARLETIRTGKERFERACKFCHNLERSLTKVKSRDEWSLTVKRMVTYGAPLNAVQRDAVTAYLGARSLFDSNCNSCHSSLRVLAKPVKGTEWSKTIERMGSHLKGLGGEEGQMKQLAQSEVEDIAAAALYLASDEGGYVIGQTLHVNGGMAML